MYQMTFYLNQVPDGHITMRVDDVPALKATLYDADGTEFAAPDYTGMSANLIIRRSDEDSTDDIIIAVEADGDVTDNIWFFNLEDVNFEPGNYEGHIELTCTYEDADATPIGPTTPLDEVYTFELFQIEVLA